MKIEIPQQKTFVCAMTLPILWGDMDAMSPVNNAVYFRYLETTRIDWMQSIGGLGGPTGMRRLVMGGTSE